jgi:L-ribulokinase
VRDAAEAMGRVSKSLYEPNEVQAAKYDRLYAEYEILHDYFGRGANNAMKRLKAMRREALDAS